MGSLPIGGRPARANAVDISASTPSPIDPLPKPYLEFLPGVGGFRMNALTELFGPLLPVLIVIAAIGAVFVGLAWLLEHPLALFIVVLCVAGGAFVLVKGKYIGSNRV